MTILPFVLLGVLIGAWFLSIKIMRITVDALASPRERMAPRSHVPSDQELRQPLRQAEEWAREHGFDDDVMFDFQIASKEQTLFCRTWKTRPRKPIWFSTTEWASTSWNWSRFTTTRPA